MASSGPEPLAANLDAPLERLGAYFLNESPLQKASYDMAAHLDELGIDYAVAGALSLAAHGLVRSTEDVDILITPEGLARFKETWLGRGYVNLRPAEKAVRDTQTGIRWISRSPVNSRAMAPRSRWRFRIRSKPP
jgi:hypothetical protein